VEAIDLCGWLGRRPEGLVAMGIDVPIGLLDGARACDRAARKILGQPRGSSVFSPPCRSAIRSKTYAEACEANYSGVGRKISRQAWGIAKKIREVDDVMMAEAQTWAFEVHPEVCFWALSGCCPMRHGKKTADGRAERLLLIRSIFSDIDVHLAQRPQHVGIDDVLDAAAAAWTALRHSEGRAKQVCNPETDPLGLMATIWY